MDSFLEEIVWDNSIRDYLITFGIIAVVLILKTILSKLVAGLIGRTMIDKHKQFNKEKFYELVLSPIKMFVIVLTVIISFYRLQFPSTLNFNIYKATFHDVLESIAKAVLIFSFVWLCNRIVAYVAHLLHQKAMITPERTDEQLVVFFRDFLKVIIWIIGVLLILKFSFGFAMSNVFTGLSIVGAALALAFRESLENLIASFIIFFDKPFTIGDVVKVQNITGAVEAIGLRSSRIRTNEKTYVTVPNKQMVDSILDNQSLRTQRNVMTFLEIALETSAVQLTGLISSVEVILEREEILDKNVFLSDTGKLAHILQVEYFVTMELPIKEFFKLREAINLNLVRILNEQNIELAASVKEIVIKREESRQQTD